MNLFEWKLKASWPSYLGENYIDDVRKVPLSLVRRFKKDYSHVKTYHACRPINIQSYLENGVCIQSFEELIEGFIANLEKYCKIELSKKEILSAIAQSRFPLHQKRLYTVLDDDFLIRYAGHYAIYGSEYIAGLAQILREETGKVSKENLKQYGMPTVLVIDLNLNKVSEYDFEALVKVVNNAIFYGVEPGSIDFTFELTDSVSPEEIVSFYNPKVINDPLEIPQVYVYNS